jgi:hypothetical protein
VSAAATIAVVATAGLLTVSSSTSQYTLAFFKRD